MFKPLAALAVVPLFFAAIHGATVLSAAQTSDPECVRSSVGASSETFQVTPAVAAQAQAHAGACSNPSEEPSDEGTARVRREESPWSR